MLLKSDYYICAILFFAVFHSNAFSQENTTATNTSTPSANVSVPSAAERKWSLSSSYGISTDIADRLNPRIYTHSLTVDAGYEFENLFSVDASLGYFFKSLNSDISKYPEDSGFSSFDISTGKVIQLGKFLGANNSLSFGVDGSLPFTEESQLEGYYGDTGLYSGLKSNFLDGLILLSNSINYSFIFNKYEYSPVDFSPTAKNSYSYQAGLKLRIIKNLYLGFGLGIRRTRFTDGFHDFTYKNTQSISYKIKKISLNISHTNGGYTDDGKAKLWYIDQYHRLVSATIGYSF